MLQLLAVLFTAVAKLFFAEAIIWI